MQAHNIEEYAVLFLLLVRNNLDDTDPSTSTAK